LIRGGRPSFDIGGSVSTNKDEPAAKAPAKSQPKSKQENEPAELPATAEPLLRGTPSQEILRQKLKKKFH
jgi:hypothetical protein